MSFVRHCACPQGLLSASVHQKLATSDRTVSLLALRTTQSRTIGSVDSDFSELARRAFRLTGRMN
eukprot:3121744-Pleurochrysis_carterae.AAC.5